MFRAHLALQCLGCGTHSAPILVPVFFFIVLLLCDIIDQVLQQHNQIEKPDTSKLKTQRTQTSSESQHNWYFTVRFF